MKCARCDAPRPANARFCAQCGLSFVAETRERHAATRIERRQVTFVFCDLVGSTALSSRLDPEDFKDILVAYRTAASSAMSAYGAHVERHIGDGSLFYLGYPQAHEDDAERAIHAALDLIAAAGAIEAAGEPLQVRVGIATGLVVIADIAHFHEHDAMGDAPNIAARLQSLAQPGSVLVDGVTRGLAGNLFEFADAGALSLKGFEEPLHGWRVVGAKPVASRFEARGDFTRLPLVGRDDELRTLSWRWKRACAGHGEIVLLLGDAGIGKSRLSAELIDEATREGGALFRFYCAPYRESSALHPFVQQLEHAAGFAPADTPADRLDKLDALLADAPAVERALLAELVNLPAAERYSVPALGLQARRARTLQALLARIERAAARSPVLIVYEDAQWSDASSRELLESLVHRTPGMPILLLVLARHDIPGDWSSKRGVARMKLGPLPLAASEALVCEVAGGKALPRPVVMGIVERTDGIPLFLEEVARARIEEEEAGDAEAMASADARVPLSAVLRASLMPRLTRLGNAREALEAAATIGRDFGSELLACVSEGTAGSNEALDRLLASGLVVCRSAREGAFAFKHALIRDVAYEIMGRDQRRALHLRVAQAIESRFPGVAETQPEVVARHYQEAGALEKCVEYWLKAGRYCLRRSAMREALQHIEAGLAVLGRMTPSPWRAQNELAFTISKGMALIATQGYAVDATGQTFSAARELCDRLGDPPQLLAVLHGLWTHALLRAEFGRAREQAAEILARGDARHDDLWRLMGHRFSGVTCHPLGEFGDAVQQLERGLDLYDPAQRATYAAMTVDDPRVVLLTYLSWSLMCTGRLEQALARSADAVARAYEIGHAYTLAHALNGAAFVALTIVSPDEALARLNQLAAVLADSGIAYYEAVEMIFRGYCLAARGEREALPLLLDGVASYRGTRSVLYLPGFLRMSAESHLRLGQRDRARALIEEARAAMEGTGQRWDEAEIHRVRAGILAAGGQRDEAAKVLRLALNVSARQGAGLWQLRAACDLADLEPAAAGELAAVVRRALESAGAPNHLPDVRRARACLDRTRSTTDIA